MKNRRGKTSDSRPILVSSLSGGGASTMLTYKPRRVGRDFYQYFTELRNPEYSSSLLREHQKLRAD